MDGVDRNDLSCIRQIFSLLRMALKNERYTSDGDGIVFHSFTVALGVVLSVGI